MSEKILTLPKAAQEVIEQYLELDIKGVVVRTPYFRNVKRVRGELRALVGKGSPAEIAEETVIYMKLRGFSLQGKGEYEIREFMLVEGLGVDCSGFVAHIYDVWLKSVGMAGVGWHYKYNYNRLLQLLIRVFRPINNLSADILTNLTNCVKVELKDVRAGDLIRMKGLRDGDHVLIITEVHLKNGILEKIVYANSSEKYEKENGIRFGEIIIRDLRKPLEDQEWLSTDQAGKKPELNGFLRELEDNGIRRPKFLNNKQVWRS